MHRFQTELIIQASIEEVFDFFSKAENLGRLTPEFLQFQILTPLPIEMRVGALIDYKIKLGVIPMKWKTEITTWEPPHRFVDTQLKGPYRTWIHEHRFEPVEGAVRMTDTVDYLSPGWFLEPLIDRLFVRRKVKSIFKHRNEVISQFFKHPSQN